MQGTLLPAFTANCTTGHKSWGAETSNMSVIPRDTWLLHDSNTLEDLYCCSRSFSPLYHFLMEQNNIYHKPHRLIFQQQPCAAHCLIFHCCSRLISALSSGQSCSSSLFSDMPSLTMSSNGASLTCLGVKVRAVHELWQIQQFPDVTLDTGWRSCATITKALHNFTKPAVV